MFTPVPEDVQIFVDAPPEAGLRSDQCWRLRKAMNGLRVSSRLFQDHLAKILRAGGFEQSTAEKCLFTHRTIRVVVTVHVDDPIVAGTSEGIRISYSTIATSSAESEYYGACACASEAVCVKELLKFIGEEAHIQLELDTSSAISMGSRVLGLGKGATCGSQILMAAATCRRQDHQASEGEGHAAPT
eukprot:6490556-Amphidinium_carterae.3